MAGGAGKLPKWQTVLLGVYPLVCTSRSYRLTKVTQPAKMAESGRKLPKWQALANLMPNQLPN